MIGLGTLAGIAAQGLSGAGPFALSVFSAVVAGGSTYLGIAQHRRRRTRQATPDPARPVRSLCVFVHPADATYGGWIGACLRTVARTRVETCGVPDPPALALTRLPTWTICVLSATWEALPAPALGQVQPDADRLIAVRVEDCETPSELAGAVVLDMAHLDEGTACTLLLRELTALGVLAEHDLPDTPALPSEDGTPFPRGGPTISNLGAHDPALVGRDALIRDLRARFLRQGEDDHGVSVAAVLGMGGVGKSSLAVSYAHRYRRHYDIIWWITADRPTSLRAGLVRLALELGVPEQADTDLLIAELRRALRERGPWLLIYDNADSVEDLRRLWPSADGGHVLITSRLADWFGLVPAGALVEIPPLSDDQAVHMLCHGTGDDDRESARGVAQLLGQLPLALSHAVAYVRQAATDLAAYRQLLEDSLEDVLTRFQPADNVQPAAMTWNLTLRRVTEQDPITLDLMRLWAMLAPEGLSRDLAGEGIDDLPGHLAPVAQDPVAYDLAVQRLRRYSLIRGRAGTAEVHRLVQSVVRRDMGPALSACWLGIAAGFLDHLFPENVADRLQWPTCSRLLPHVMALHSNVHRLERVSPGTSIEADTEIALGRLLHHTGRYLVERSSYDEALKPLSTALKLRENAHGQRSTEVAETQLCLGITLYRRADIVGARQAVTTALQIQTQLDGPDSAALYRFLLWKCMVFIEFSELDEAFEAAERGRHVLITAGDAEDARLTEIDGARGMVMWRLGRFRDAVQTLGDVVDGSRRLFGENDDQTLAAEGNLAFVQTDLGRVVDDRELLRNAARRLTDISDTLAGRLGDTHFTVMEHRKTLASALCWLGDLEAARRIFEPVVATYRDTLGHHPSTVAAERLYAVVLARQGETERAQRLLRDGERLYESIYGADHPYVAEILVDYGPVLAAAGHADQARDVLLRARRIVERTYGSDHPKLVQVFTELSAIPGVTTDEAERLRGLAASIKARM
ncbi:tetratricopeptide repeat protein [Actinomadura sp. 1N219]|uniref:tetratricopeptide repeat protein n=1 Tax=Actinomadura sp. 1N219 TaxID=3375152 RepID=UPI0037A212C4